MSLSGTAKSAVADTPIAGPFIKRSFRAARRYRFGLSYYSNQLRVLRRWSWARTEDSNFYYNLTQRNEATLCSLISVVCGKDVDVVEGYVAEIRQDTKLQNHIRNFFLDQPELEDSTVAFGRRIGWYAFVRALKPTLVVETGVAHGVGACVLASALLRNQEEGHEGTYLGTEIDNNAGELFTNPYSQVGEIRFGDSIYTLNGLSQEIDIFVNDSDHSEEYEAREYEVIKGNLSTRSVILGDNSHVTRCLREFSKVQRRPYLFFREEPQDHWYPGAGIGISPTTIPIFAR